MRKKNTTERRLALNGRTYETARRMEEMMPAPYVPGETKDMLAGMLHRLAAVVGVDLAHPNIVRAAVIECAYAYRDMEPGEEKERAYRLLNDLKSWTSTAAGVCAKYEGMEDAAHLTRRSHTFGLTSRQPRDDEPAEVEDEKPPAINMGAWLDSHPRPIRNLLFAEKEGA